MTELNTFQAVLNEHYYDAAFWAKAVAMYWYEQTCAQVDWFDTPSGVDFAYRLCWELSDGGVYRNVYIEI